MNDRVLLRAAIAQAIDSDDLDGAQVKAVVLGIFDELCDLKDDIKRIADAITAKEG